MTLVLRVKALNKPPRPNVVDIIELPATYEFAPTAKLIDEAVRDERDIVFRTADGKLRLVDPSMSQMIALREELPCR